MAAGDVNPVYVTPTTGTGGITSLASSSTWVAGYEWIVIDIAGMSPIPSRIRVSGQATVGTTPTVNTQIRLYAIGSDDGTTWPDVFDGTESAETITSVGVRDGFAKLAAVMPVDATTSNRPYPFDFELSSLFSGALPDSVAIFATHNCGSALNSTAGNHTWTVAPQYDRVAQS
jgi:hypothetical protein